MSESEIHYNRIIVIGVIAIIVLGAVIIIVDRQDFVGIFGKADWLFFGLSLFTTAGAMFFQCYSFIVINRLFGVDTGFFNLLGTGFASIALGNVVSAPFGITEHSVRGALLVPQGHKFGDVEAASISHSYVKDVAILTLAPASILFQMFTERLTMRALGILAFLVFLTVGVLALLTVMLLSEDVRGSLVEAAARLWHFFTRRSAQKQLSDFDNAIERIKLKLRRQPRTALLIFGLMVGDWIFTLGTLELCFVAFGIVPPVLVLVSGFIIGKTAAILSLIPGGIGVRSASTAGAFALFGISFNVSILAVVLFRFVYDFVPYLVSFSIMHSLLRRIYR